ncbi:MAG TPA: hypothetical protein VJ144_06760 [Candidatus Polarisedimenticolia bacterium]|nr:hypothetical protein [Candidatus Polarisedimenticolia bacterium]
MKRPVLIAIAVVLAAGVERTGASRAGAGDVTLFDGPRGAWLGTLRSDAPIAVVEERDGWRRVRVEGWISASSAGPGHPDVTRPEAGPAPLPQGTGKPFAAGVAVSGVLLPPGDTAGPVGAGLIVQLLSDPEGFDREHGSAGEECRARLREATDRIAALRAQLDKALSSSDNFREAAQRNDRLKAQIAAAEQERAERLSGCRRAADAIIERHTVKRTVSDSHGAFIFDSVEPGRYRVAALEAGGDRPRAWLLDCLVDGEPLVLDPRRDRAPIDPYWGLFAAVRP